MRKVCFFIALVALVSGCAVNVRTTGFLDRRPGTSAPSPGSSFAVLENNQAANPILDREIRFKIEKLLLARGYRIAAREQALYALTFDYNISPGLRTGVTTVYSRGQMQMTPVPDGKGGTTYINVMTPGTTTAVPTLTDVFTKHLTLKIMEARSLAAGQNEKIIWIGETVSTDASSDLRSDIDYLLAAVFSYFGLDTGKQINVPVGKDNADVRALRTETGLPPR